MAIAITLPRQGWSMDEATFVQWLKANGDAVQAGEPLFAVETDKAVQEIESLDAGVLRIPPDAPGPGDIVRVGDVIGYLIEHGEDISCEPTPCSDHLESSHARPKTEDSLPASSVQQHPDPAIRPMPASPQPLGTAIAVTPRAARCALRDGIDLRNVTGSGKAGRIRERDVSAAAARTPRAEPRVRPTPGPASAPVSPGDREVPITGLRRTIAERMLLSSTSTAPVTLTTQADAGALVSLRDQFKATAVADEPVPSLSDMIVKLVGHALQDFPLLTARWEETRIVIPGSIHIGLAVDTPDGLLVPVIRDVPALSLRQLALHTRDLIDRARARHLTSAELTGGTFTVTNLGALGVDTFTPIINYPECAVLGVGRIRRMPAVVDSQVVIRDQLWLSLTFDHRIVDGAPAARFLDAVRQAVECAAARLID